MADRRTRTKWGATLLLAAVALSGCTGGAQPTARSESRSPSPSPTPTVSHADFALELFDLCDRVAANYPRFSKVRTHKQWRKAIERAVKVHRQFVTGLSKQGAPEGFEATYDAYLKENERLLRVLQALEKTTRRKIKGSRGNARLLNNVVKGIKTTERYLDLALATEVPPRCLFGINRRALHRDLFSVRADIVCNRKFPELKAIGDRLEATSSPSSASDAFGDLQSLQRDIVGRLNKMLAADVPQRARFKQAFARYRAASDKLSAMVSALDALSQSSYEAAFDDWEQAGKQARKAGKRMDLFLCNSVF